MDSSQKSITQLLRERVDGDAVAPFVVREYLGKDCAGIVGEYLRPERLPFLQELRDKTRQVRWYLPIGALWYITTNRCPGSGSGEWALCNCKESKRKPRKLRPCDHAGSTSGP